MRLECACVSHQHLLLATLFTYFICRNIWCLPKAHVGLQDRRLRSMLLSNPLHPVRMFLTPKAPEQSRDRNSTKHPKQKETATIRNGALENWSSQNRGQSAPRKVGQVRAIPGHKAGQTTRNFKKSHAPLSSPSYHALTTDVAGLARLDQSQTTTNSGQNMPSGARLGKYA